MSTLLAGRDTTACTLSWLFYEFAYQPEVRLLGFWEGVDGVDL